MDICKFFQQGHCKFGDWCKFEHPGAGQGRRQGAPQNPFPPLTRSQGLANQRGSSGHDSRQSDGRRHRNDNADLPFYLSTRTIRDDLTLELPLWPLSAYGPGRDAPRQLIEGESEQSPEEMRVLFYLARLQNNPQPAIQDEQARATNAQSQVEAILRDLDGACQYIVDGQQQHPNRWDICNETNNTARSHRQRQQRAPDFRSQATNPFNLPKQAGTAGAGGGNAPVNPFGKPPPVNPFGPPPTQQAVNAFNSTPAPQPSAFGKPSMPQNPFGQPLTAKPVNPFGQPPPSTGQQPPNPFAQPAHTNRFSNPANPQSHFGQPAGATTSAPPASGPFNTASPFQQPGTSRAGPAQGSWGQQQPSANPFSAQPTPRSSGIGAQQPAPAGFASRAGQPAAGLQTNGSSSPFGSTPSQPIQAAGGSRTFGQAPDYYADTEAPLQDYGPEGSDRWRGLEEIYRKANETGRFDGLVPEEPPLHQWRDYAL